MEPPQAGRLAGPGDAPAQGERARLVARVGTTAIEQIVSGVVDVPVDFDQDHDEWVLLLEGAAELEVGRPAGGGPATRHHLRPGSWLLLPAGTPHRLLSVSLGTTWLAVHGLPG